MNVFITEAELVRRISAALRKKSSPVAKLNDVQELLDLRGPNARVRDLMDRFSQTVRNNTALRLRLDQVRLALQEDTSAAPPRCVGQIRQ